MPCGKKRKRHKIATHKRKKRLRKNRHKKNNILYSVFECHYVFHPSSLMVLQTL